MVADVWGGLDQYYPVEVDAFVVMPNHVHGILVLNESLKADGAGRADRHRGAVPTETRMRGVSMSLSTIMQRFKTYTMYEYGKGVREQGWQRYPGRLWQQRFHEHVIRNERDLSAIREYIRNNPLQWELDRENPDRES
jgi:REP element-mobilizing transposase RayT